MAMSKYVNLPTKVALPNIESYVERRNLFNTLDQQKGKKITWIAAPGGAGKTILISSYLNSCASTTFWYQVDSRDSDPANLFHYLAIAAKDVDLPQFSPEYFSVLPLFTANYFEALFSRVKTPFSLVFDNLQDAPDGSAVASAISMAAKQLPEGGRIFCISRDLPSAEFSELRAKRDLYLLGEEQLRFDVNETMALAKICCSDAISGRNAETLHRKTMGWAAGLVLLLESPGLMSLSPDRLLARENVIFDYFSNEFLSRWDDEVRRFLVTTSLLPRFTVDAASRISGTSRAADILSLLLRKNFFIVPYSNDHSSYQYHPIFREFLLHKIQDFLSSEELQETRRAAAQILISTGHASDAIDILHSIGDWDVIAKTILTEAPGMISKGQLTTLRQWLALLPKDYADPTPWLLYWRGVCEILISIDNAMGMLLQAYNEFRRINDMDGMAMSLAIMAESSVIKWGNMGEMQRILSLYDSSFPPDYVCPDPLIEARLTASMALLFSVCETPGEKYAQLIKRISASYEVVGDIDLKLNLASRLLYYHTIVTGQKTDCERFLHEMFVMIQEHPDINMFTLFLWKYTTAFYYWNIADYQSMERVAKEIYHGSEKMGISHLYGLFLKMLPVCYAASGRFESAQHWLGKYYQSLDKSDCMAKASYHFAASLLECNMRNYDSAVENGILSTAASTEAGSNNVKYLYNTQLCRCFFLAGRLEEALALVASVREFNQKFGSRPLDFILTVIETAGLIRSMDGVAQLSEKIESGLRHVLTMEEHGGSAYGLGWSTEDMALLCSVALDKGIMTSQALAAIRRHKLNPSKDYPTPFNWQGFCHADTFGPFDVKLDGISILKGKSTSKPWQLFKLLIVLGPANIPAETVEDTLWPDSEGDAAHSAFSTTMQRLRKLLGDVDLIRVQNNSISLNTDLITLDINGFWNSLRLINESKTYRKDLATFFVNTYKLPFMEGDNSPWMAPFRDRMSMEFLSALGKLMDLSEAESLWTEAEWLYRVGIERYPENEALYQGLMRCHLRQGNVAEGLATFEHCRKTLENQCGKTVSALTIRIREELTL